MTTDQISGALQQWLTGRGRASASLDDNFVEACELDSFDVMELVTFAETRFAIAFTAADLEHPRFPTLAGLASLISAHLADTKP